MPSYPISVNGAASWHSPVRFRPTRAQSAFLACLFLALLAVVALLAILLAFLLRFHFQYQNNSKIAEFTSEEIRSSIFANIGADRIAHNLELITQKPHQAGTNANRKVAEQLMDIWKANGIEDAHMIPYEVLLSYPKWDSPNHVTVLADNGRVLYRTSGVTPDVDGNDNSPEASIQWLAYSPQGTVEGEPVYCHYGRTEDYARLAKDFGITDLKGKIAIMRYGGNWRGDMVRNAADRGALAAILYSDPAEIAKDGIGPKKVYPNTDWLPAEGVQRGSTAETTGGDPLSPLLPSRSDFHREKTIDQVRNDPNVLPQIPALPLGYGDAYHILSQMGGAEVPAEWRGGLNFTYRTGPGFRKGVPQRKVRVEVKSTLEVRKIQNVVGYIWGNEYPDEWVLLGNHFDAWVYGAVDPNSGTSIMAEVGKGFAETVRVKGWRPRRTLVFCAWDAEEHKLIGSTEFVEEFANVLTERAVAYLNLDLLSSNQTLDVNTVPTLYPAVVEAAKMVADPVNAGRTMYDTWREHFPPEADLPEVPSMGLPGGGSDHAAFLNFLGIPVVDFTYRDTNRTQYPLYHSRYERPFVNEHLIDHNHLAVHTALGQYWAELARLLADSPVLPLSASTYGHKLLTEYVQGVKGPILDLYAKFANATEPAKRQLDNLLQNVHLFIAEADKFEAKIGGGDKEMAKKDARWANVRLRKLEQCFVNPALGMAREEPTKRHVLFSLASGNTYSAAVMASVGKKIDQLAKASTDKDRARFGRELALELTVVQQAVLCAVNTLRSAV